MNVAGIIGQLGGAGIAAPIDAIGRALDKLFTSDDERAAAAAVMEKLRQHPGELQVELNKIEAAHRSVFVAGWRPAIGWVAAVSLGCFYIPQYAVASWLWVHNSLAAGAIVPYPATAEGLVELVLALLGLGAMRTFEKATGTAR